MRHLFSTSAMAVLALASSATAVMAQETTSSVRGAITSAGAPVVGATLTITHTPSGTVSTAVTGSGGAFAASGLRPGGPYSIVVSADGFQEATYNDISLTVGTPYNLPIVLESGSSVDELIVTAVRRPDEPLSTTFDRNAIEGVASVARDIRDIARQDPFASFNPSSRGISIAGANQRTNKFSVDGVRFSDNFGLQQGGLPTGRGPVPLDAVEQLSVKVAPYDITEGDFQGGAINVVLRSGENKLTGSAFYTYTDDSLLGDKTRGTNTNFSLSSKNWGGFVSGPLIKDKLFFAFAFEKLDEVVPSDFGLAGAPNVVPGLTQGLLDSVTSTAQSVYGYDTRGLLLSRPETDEKYTLKLDYNLSDVHRLSYTFIHNSGTTIAMGGGSSNASTPSVGFQSYATLEPEKVDSHVFQVNSNWTNNFSSEVRFNYRESSKIPVSFGSPGFAQFSVCSDPLAAGAANTAPLVCLPGNPRLLFGTEQFSQRDVVGQKQYGADFVGRLTVGNHVIKAQAAFSELKIENEFVHSSLGVYTFDTLADFQAKRASILSFQNSITGDLDDLSASFNYTQYILGLQDSWDLTPSVNLTYGVRTDLYKMDDRSPLNKSFVNRYGFANNENIDGNIVVQPRANLTWRTTDRLTLRGGVGLFSGGAPDVFLGNSFSVAGVFGNTITIQRQDGTPTGCTANSIPASIPTAQAAQICAAALTNVNGLTFDPSVLQFLQTNTAALSAAPVNGMSKDFKLPSTWKFSLSADYDADFTQWGLGDGWKFGGDLYYGKVKNAALYTDLRLTRTGTAPDGRPIYADTFTNGNNQDLFMTNTSKGYSLVAVARANKYWGFGLGTGLSYTYSDVKSLGDQNSTTAAGTFGGQPMVDPNYPEYGTSDYEVKHNWKANIDYAHAFWGDNESRISVFADYRTGAPYSLTMNTRTNRNVYGTVGTSSRYLLYVPNVSSITADPIVTYANQAAYEFMRDLVTSRGLTQGAIIGKNTENAPDYFKVDLHIEQEVPAPLAPGGKLKLFADVENLLNMIDDKYGSYRTVASLQPVVDVNCVAVGGNACAQYRYSVPTPINVINNGRLGLWNVRIGAKFEF